jgi:hypothetical protein
MPVIRMMRIATGQQGTLETLRAMRAIVNDATRDPVVTTLAFTLFEECKCLRCLKCVVELIDLWTRDHFVYVSDGDEMEIINTPGYDIKQIADTGNFGGDCDDVAVFSAALFKSLGLQLRFVAIKTDPVENFSHVYVEVYCADQWVVVDPTVPMGTPYEQYGRMVLNV